MNTNYINSNLSELNIFIFCEINNRLTNKVTYSSNHISNNTISYCIAIERSESEEDESIEGIIVKSIIDYNEQYIGQIKEYNEILITQYETELQVLISIEYISEI